MSNQTPEQIAADVADGQGYVNDGDLHAVSADRIRGLIAQGIETDRAQRPAAPTVEQSLAEIANALGNGGYNIGYLLDHIADGLSERGL